METRCDPSAQTRGRSRQGSSLVEVLLAASMLSVSMLGALRSQVSSVQLMKEARETELAVQVLHEAMARAQLETNAELAGADGDLAPGEPLATSLVLTDQVVQYTLPGLADGDPVPVCLGLRFQISWTSSSGLPRTLALVGAKR